jgi:hypothetical protein
MSDRCFDRAEGRDEKMLKLSIFGFGEDVDLSLGVSAAVGSFLPYSLSIVLLTKPFAIDAASDSSNGS